MRRAATTLSTAAAPRMSRRARGRRTPAVRGRGSREARSGREPSARGRALLLALAIGLSGALAVAAMRNDLLRVQYGLAQALDETQALERERNASLARVRALRDPAHLRRLAEERGFVRPARIVDLPVDVGAAPPGRGSGGRP